MGSLPTDVVGVVAEYAIPSTLVSMSNVCHRWLEGVVGAEAMWQRFVTDGFGYAYGMRSLHKRRMALHPAQPFNCRVEKFSDLPVKNEDLLRNIHACGFVETSSIQARALLGLIVSSKDLVVRSACGTGKTTLAGIAALNAFDLPSVGKLQVLVLCSGREVSFATEHFIGELGRGVLQDEHLCACFVGGRPFKADALLCRSGRVAVAVGTPGRILDLKSRGEVILNNLRLICFDDFDDAVKRGFADQIQQLLEFIPASCRRMAFISTTNEWIDIELHKCMFRPNPPSWFEEQWEQPRIDGAKHSYIVAPVIEVRVAALCSLLSRTPTQKCVLFFNTRQCALMVVEEIRRRTGVSLDFLFSEMQSIERNKRVLRFSENAIQHLALIGSELKNELAGKPLPPLLFVNVQLPQSVEEYLERVGSLAPHWEHWQVLSFVTPTDVGSNVKNIEDEANILFRGHDVR